MVEPTHFVYIYKEPTDPRFGWELLYSIRSIYKNFKEPFDITIIGDIPKWINQEICICINENYLKLPNKQHRITSKIILASTLYEEFVIMHDDIYITRPITIEDIKDDRYINIFSKTQILNYDVKMIDTFMEQLYYTLQILQKLGKECIYNYATHTPTHVTRNNINELCERVKFSSFEPILFDVLYNGYFIKNHKLITRDYKTGFYKSTTSELTMESKFFNHDENGFLNNPRIISMLSDIFKEKTKAEK